LFEILQGRVHYRKLHEDKCGNKDQDPEEEEVNEGGDIEGKGEEHEDEEEGDGEDDNGGEEQEGGEGEQEQKRGEGGCQEQTDCAPEECGKLTKDQFYDDEDGSKQQVNEHYMDAVMWLMPCIVGKKNWMVKGSNTEGEYTNMVTVVDKTFLIWTLDCYWNSWVEEKLRVKGKGEIERERPWDKPWHIKQVQKNGREGTNGTKCSGITVLGKKRWNEWFRLVQKNRKDARKFQYFQKAFKDFWEREYGEGAKRSGGNQEDDLVSEGKDEL
jgi:hypothetical protein